MKCSFPPPLKDDELAMLLDNTADDSLWQHLSQCPYCQSRLEKTRQSANQLDNHLKKRLFRLDCPSPHIFVDYFFERLTTDEYANVQQHLKICPHCQSDFAELRRFMQKPATTPEKSKPKARLGQILTTLSNVLEPNTRLAAGFRGDGSGFLFEAEGVTIFLNVQQRTTGRQLTGQVLTLKDSESWAGSIVELRQSGELKSTVFIDESGRFVCPLLVGEALELRITNTQNQSLLMKGLEFKD